MTTTQLPFSAHARQAPINLIHPTPVEIRIALYTVLDEDARNPSTPRIPVHIGGLIREAITRANAGEFQ